MLVGRSGGSACRIFTVGVQPFIRSAEIKRSMRRTAGSELRA